MSRLRIIVIAALIVCEISEQVSANGHSHEDCPITGRQGDNADCEESDRQGTTNTYGNSGSRGKQGATNTYGDSGSSGRQDSRDDSNGQVIRPGSIASQISENIRLDPDDSSHSIESRLNNATPGINREPRPSNGSRHGQSRPSNGSRPGNSASSGGNGGRQGPNLRRPPRRNRCRQPHCTSLCSRLRFYGTRVRYTGGVCVTSTKCVCYF